MQTGNLILILIALLLAGAFFSVTSSHELPYFAYGGGENQKHVILFTGDVMLGREVERKMDMFGDMYPFTGITELLSSADAVVVNFEAAIPKEHVETPDFGFQFSVEKEKLAVLREVGIEYLSLGNNHSYDFGSDGYTHTKEVCLEKDIVCEGVPHGVSHMIVELDGLSLGILILDDTYTVVPEEDVLSVLNILSDTSDIQIAYIHWGEEYVSEHNSVQEARAHFLIDHGVDGVMGHHPHVVQDIEIYRDAPIFYSLGNLIFDQYFSDEVQEGLIVQLAVTQNTLDFSLIPVSSAETHSQPQILGEDAKEVYLAELFARSGLRGESVLSFSRRGLAQDSIISTMRPH